MFVLQTMVFPEPGICTEQDLYFRRVGSTAYSQATHTLELKEEAAIHFNTYFNALSIGKWETDCELDDLFLELSGSGRVEIRVFHSQPMQSWELMANEVTTLDSDTPYLLDLSVYKEHPRRGMIYFEVRALEDGVTITGQRYLTNTAPRTLPKLAISITTFKREKEVRTTVRRLQEFLSQHTFGDNIHVQVVDNGQSAEIEASANVTPITNENLGGAGGFARGLLEAENAGFTHVLFMDDDASFHMENIARTYAYLALATKPNAAVAGAMINNTHKWAMWEAGAIFDGSCRPLHVGRDLRDWGQITVMEDEGLTHHHQTLYGGWWYFAFAIDQVKHHPFPFFVRGDDISFSLANDFGIRTLNGIVSFQDDFTEKESPQTLYLDLRNHLLHHLIFEKLERSAWGVAKIALFFAGRSLMRFHYESAEAQIMALEDVMRGPEFFDEHADMSVRRGDIKALIKDEAWGDIRTVSPKASGRLHRLPASVRRVLALLTLNGHLVPFWSKLGDTRVLNMAERGFVGRTYGASKVTYINGLGDKCYTVETSKDRGFKLGLRLFKNVRRFVREYPDLQAKYRKGYDTLTTKGYWENKLHPDEDA